MMCVSYEQKMEMKQIMHDRKKSKINNDTSKSKCHLFSTANKR